MHAEDLTLTNLPGRYEEAILASLIRLGRKAGASELREEVESRTAPGRIAVGVLYATLDRLSKKGFVLVSDEPPSGVKGERGKKLFDISPAGRDAALRARKVTDRLWEGIAQPC